MNAPEIFRLADCDGDWERYIDNVYRIFIRDVVRQDLSFKGLPISVRRHPESFGKSFGFWHMVQEGEVEEDRTPDMRRCERIPQVAWIIENAETSESIDIWEQRRGRERNWVLWYDEYYLVILARRSGYLLLKTAYCTERQHRVNKYRKERDDYWKRCG